MERLGISKTFLLVVLLLILCLVLLYIYLVMPKQEELAALQDDLSSKMARIQQLESQVASLSQSSKGNLAVLQKVRAQVPEEPYIELWLRDLRKLETISGLKFESYAYSLDGKLELDSLDSEDVSLVSVLDYSTTVEGNYAQIHRLLEEIETEQRLIVIQNLNLEWLVESEIHRNQPDGEMTASIALKTLYAPDLAHLFERPLPTDYEAPGGHKNPFF